MFHSSPACRRAVFPAVVALAMAATLSIDAAAQPVIAPPVSAVGLDVPGVPAPGLRYHSVLETYRPWTDEKPILWKEANDTVYLRGGWQAYAKESAEPDLSEPPPVKDMP